jgi:hypothetical protein
MPRRFQFSLKSFLVVVLIVAAFFGGMALQWRIDHHPLLIEVQTIYDDDGAGGFQFEMRMRTDRKKVR